MMNVNESVVADIEICSKGRKISEVIFDSSAGCDRFLSLLSDYQRVFVVVDRAVLCKCAPVEALLKKLGDVPFLEIEASEQCKTMTTVLEICGWMLDNGADRDALVVGIGGGITLDMTGFAASIYKRGVRFAYIPTTLLAQVDAGIGGKTGVNFDRYKNILGVIRQPEFSYLNVSMLASLPKRDFLSGAAEMLKTFIIEDNGYYSRAIGYIKEYISDSTVVPFVNDELLELVAASAAVKAGVVSRDQFESGERRLLNLGHTFAHAIETLASRRVAECTDGQWDITHGEAVAVGMVMAARLAEVLGMAKTGLANCFEEDFKSCGLPVECPFEIEEMLEVMSKDKKAEGAIVHFVLPLSVGRVVIEDLSVDAVVKILKNCKL